jgi:hypothetical protein
MFSCSNGKEPGIPWDSRYPVRKGRDTTKMKRESDREDKQRTSGTTIRLSRKVRQRINTRSVRRSAQTLGRGVQPHSNGESSHRTICPKRKIGTKNRHIWKT